jgi:hypothetical protein
LLPTNELAEGAELALPLFLGFVAHGLVIRFKLMKGLARPIDRGVMLRGRRLFGDNRRWARRRCWPSCPTAC